MSNVKLLNHAQLLRAIKELRSEWVDQGCPHDLSEGSLFRRLLNLYVGIGVEAGEIANLLDPIRLEEAA